MSFKFERDTYKHSEGGVAGVADAAMSAAADARDQLLGRNPPLPGTTGKHPISETIGTALTGGKKNAGTKGYLAVRPPCSFCGGAASSPLQATVAAR